MDTALPATIWRETDGNYESVQTGTNFIVDTVGNFLVDTVGNFVVDTGIAMQVTPATTWQENEAI